MLARPFLAIYRQPPAARELFKPFSDSAILPDDIEKETFFVLGLSFSGGTLQVGLFFCYFGHLSLLLGAVPMGHFLDANFSSKLGQNPRL